jgi:hypothetical protein
MPPALTTGFANHMAPGIRQIVGTNLGARKSYYSMLYNVETTVRNYEDYLAGVGLPAAVEKPQGENIVAFDPIEGTTKRLTPKVYAIAMEVSEEAWEDDLYANKGSAIRDGANGLADSLAERVEIEAHKPWTTVTGGGFDTSVFTVLPDLSAFFSTTHAAITGGQGVTQANQPTTDADLAVISLRAALIQFRKYKNDQGLRIPGISQPTKLIVSPDDEYNAMEIIKSPDRPDTANRAVNVTPSLQIVCDPYLSDDTDAWFLQSDKHYAYFLWRKRPTLDSFDDRRAHVAIHTILGRFSNAPVHWLGNYGTKGI